MDSSQWELSFSKHIPLIVCEYKIHRVIRISRIDIEKSSSTGEGCHLGGMKKQWQDGDPPPVGCWRDSETKGCTRRPEKRGHIGELCRLSPSVRISLKWPLRGFFPLHWKKLHRMQQEHLTQPDWIFSWEHPHTTGGWCPTESPTSKVASVSPLLPAVPSPPLAPDF